MAATVCLGENMKKVLSPCYKCEERKLGCHSVCERYIAYAGVMAENRQERREYGERISNTHTILTHTELKKRSGK